MPSPARVCVIARQAAARRADQRTRLRRHDAAERIEDRFDSCSTAEGAWRPVRRCRGGRSVPSRRHRSGSGTTRRSCARASPASVASGGVRARIELQREFVAMRSVTTARDRPNRTLTVQTAQERWTAGVANRRRPRRTRRSRGSGRPCMRGDSAHRQPHRPALRRPAARRADPEAASRSMRYGRLPPYGPPSAGVKPDSPRLRRRRHRAACGRFASAVRPPADDDHAPATERKATGYTAYIFQQMRPVPAAPLPPPGPLFAALVTLPGLGVGRSGTIVRPGGLRRSRARDRADARLGPSCISTVRPWFVQRRSKNSGSRRDDEILFGFTARGDASSGRAGDHRDGCCGGLRQPHARRRPGPGTVAAVVLSTS